MHNFIVYGTNSFYTREYNAAAQINASRFYTSYRSRRSAIYIRTNMP